MKPVATLSCQPYQVFINHRGKDTKLTFASLIYHALEPYGLPVFLDQYVLCPGDTIETAILGAIRTSSVHIAIFSKNYAESHWCLKELCWMLTSSHKPWFIPIFCDVEPWELRFIEKGCYAEAFQKHRERGSMEVVDEWKEALGKAADISGKVFKGKEALGKATGNSDTVFNWKESDDYGKLQRDIANAVMKHVKPDPLEVAPHPVGLDQAWKDLHDQIKKQSSKKVVVIAGLGGIGKSTLARHIFNELSRFEFRRACFLYNVRETVDLRRLQRKLSRVLAGINQPISDTNEGKTMLRKSLEGLKILIVFDDVDKWDKIERVLDVHAVKEGSLIFVTSRDKDVVGLPYKKTSFVYDVELLNNEHARQLFCYHATRQSNSHEGCADLVKDFLKICEGLPLCLQVLGEQVSSKSDRAHWERQLKLYSQGEGLAEAKVVIEKLLKWSCKDMDREQRRMLLDVAYFLVGEDKKLAVQVLEGLGYKMVESSLKRLCETYLISFKNDVEYHQVMTMFQRSARETSGCSVRELALRSLSTILTKSSSKMIMHNEVQEMARFILTEDQSEPLRLRCAVDFEKQVCEVPISLNFSASNYNLFDILTLDVSYNGWFEIMPFDVFKIMFF